MFLNSTAESIRAYLASAATTTNPTYLTSYADHQLGTPFFIPGNDHGNFNGTTPVTIIGSPTGSVYRQLEYASIYNADTISHLVTIDMLDTAIATPDTKATLDPGDFLRFTRATGWLPFNKEGVERFGGITSNRGPWMASPDLANFTANITGVKSITSGNTYMIYVGRAGKATSNVTIRYNVTTAAVTVTWAELAVFKGLPLVAAAPSLSRLGYFDVAGVVTSTGRKSTNFTLTTEIAIGDDIWIGYGNNATTVAVMRAYSLIEDLQLGSTVVMAARPSTVASPTSWTVDNAVGLWYALYLN